MIITINTGSSLLLLNQHGQAFHIVILTVAFSLGVDCL